MELSIPSHSIKDFTAVLKCFKSFSDHIHIQAHPSYLNISAVSPTRSTYAVAKYEESYFDSYKLKSNELGIIEVAVKPLYRILSQKTFPSSIDSCHFSIQTDQLNGSNNRSQDLDPIEPSSSNRLKIQLQLTVGIIKSFSLQYSISKALNPIDIRSMNSPNYWICHSTSLKQWIDHFVTNPNLIGHSGAGGGGGSSKAGLDANEEISFRYHQDGRIVLKTVNLTDDTDRGVVVPRNIDIFSKGARQVSTALTISSDEFEDYNVNFNPMASTPISQAQANRPLASSDGNEMMMITISMKEFRSILELGTSLDAAIDAGFSIGGRPFYISIANGDENLTMDFILASTGGDELSALDRLGPNIAPVERSVHSTAIRPSNDPVQSVERGRRESHSQAPIRSEPLTPIAGPSTLAHPPPRTLPLFRSQDLQEEKGEEVGVEVDDELLPDELDGLDPDRWEQLEQEALVQSQARDSQRLLSQPSVGNSHQIDRDLQNQKSGITDEDDRNQDEDESEVDDEQLLPTQIDPDQQRRQGRWRVFFD